MLRHQVGAQLEDGLGKLAEEITADIERKLTERKLAEDHRAGRRNRNRGLTMLIAIIGAFCVPTLIVAGGWVFLLPYATAFTIAPDCLVTLYAWIRKY
jgi:ferric-dicitrate binding protein FerR (iron transport regulator)